MPPTFNPLSLFLGNIKRKRAITALESRGGLTDMTVADAETLVEELDRVRLTLENSLTCSELPIP